MTKNIGWTYCRYIAYSQLIGRTESGLRLNHPATSLTLEFGGRSVQKNAGVPKHEE